MDSTVGWKRFSLAVVLLGTLLLVTHGLAGLTVFLLFARLREQRFEDNETRRRISQLISREPGLNLSDIVARLDIGWGTAAYHTQILLRQKKVHDLRFLNRVCFFASSESSGDQQLQTILLRQPNYEGVMRALLGSPGASQRELAALMGHARQYISRMVGKLQRAGLVRFQPGPTGRRYFPIAADVPEPEADPETIPQEPPGSAPPQSPLSPLTVIR